MRHNVMSCKISIRQACPAIVYQEPTFLVAVTPVHSLSSQPRAGDVPGTADAWVVLDLALVFVYPGGVAWLVANLRWHQQIV